MRLFGMGALPVLTALLTACVSAIGPVAPGDSTVPAATPAPPASTAAAAPDGLYRQTGIAAWSGREYHGRTTASGEIFDMNGLSAAHRTLPLGTTIRVTNLDNSKSISVRIIDRGPLVKSRVLDLSYGAAKELGFVGQGTTRVKIETLEPVRNSASYTIQAAVFWEEENARMLKERLSKRFEQVAIIPFETNFGKLYRVRVGSYASQERAEQVAGKLTLEGLEPIVFRKD